MRKIFTAICDSQRRNIYQAMVHIANPPRIPVINLLTFVLVQSPRACPVPSKTSGASNTTLAVGSGIQERVVKTIAVTQPVSIPVHLEQSGNCLPFKKKDLSALLWQKHKKKVLFSVFKVITGQ
jgi:hypothetical protein